MKHFSLFYILILSFNISIGNVNNTKTILAALSEDNINHHEKINLYHELVKAYLPDSANLAVQYAKKALNLATSYNNDLLFYDSKYYLGQTLFEMDEYTEAKSNYLDCLSFYKKNSAYDKLAECHFKIGLIGFYTSNNSDAMLNFVKSLKLFKKLDDQQNIAQVYQNLGLVYYEIDDIDEALDHYYKSLAINKKLKNEERCASLLHNIGVVYYSQEEYELAERNYKKSLKIFKRLDFKEGIASTLSNIGLINEIQKNYPVALEYYRAALQTFRQINYLRGIALATYNVASAYQNLEDFQNAEKYFNLSIDISKTHGFKENLKDSYLSLSYLLENAGKFQDAMTYYKEYDHLSDSLYSAKNQQKLKEIESRYGLEIKEQEIAKKNAEIKQKTTLNYATIIGLLFLLIVTVLILIQSKNKKKAQVELEKHRDQLEELVKQRTAELKIEITERKIAEESDKLKSAFLANMSHEIRTPMNSIIAFSRFLKDPCLSEERRNEYIGYITSCGKNLLQLIDDIIDSAKIEARQMVIQKTSCNINNMLTEVYNMIRESKTNRLKNIDFVLNKNNFDSEYIINTDYNRLRQILLNLLENAFKYTKSGSIEFGFENKANHLLEFYVKDTGIGIPGEKINLIFERFRQVEVSLDKKYSGTGLGLAISKNLIELLGGKIWVISKVGKGSAFYFTIPYNHIERTNKKSASSRKKELKNKNIPNWTNKKVLIAEDEDLNYRVMEVALQKTNIDISRAKDGIEAVEKCKNNKFDLVLMDIQMPRMDGYTATRQIKQGDPSMPVIAQTSFALVEDKDKCLEAGCDDYLSKPINLNDLLEKMENLMPRTQAEKKESVKLSS